MNLTVQGQSSYFGGTIDTFTPVVNFKDNAEDRHQNGPYDAIIQIERALGVATLLRGTHPDLQTRLNVRINQDGTLKTVPVAEGGTGLTGLAIGDLLYASSATALSRLAMPAVATGRWKTLAVNDAANAPTWVRGLLTHGPTSIEASSAVAHQGSISWSGSATERVYHFTNATILNATTVTCQKDCTIIYCSQELQIEGTLTALGKGQLGGTGGLTTGPAGTNAGAQPGGGGGGGQAHSGGAGGDVLDLLDSSVIQTGASGGGITTNGSAATQVVGDDVLLNIMQFLRDKGGAGGGAGAGDNGARNGGDGGQGGGTLVLIAPTISGAGTIITSGAPGTDGAGGGGHTGGGAGGGAGNLHVFTNFWQFTGTITQDGGLGGNGAGSGGDGGAGAAGKFQINSYN